MLTVYYQLIIYKQYQLLLDKNDIDYYKSINVDENNDNISIEEEELKNLYRNLYSGNVLEYKYFQPSVIFEIDSKNISDCGETTLINLFLQILSDVELNIVKDNNQFPLYLQNFNTKYSKKLSEFFKTFDTFDKLDTVNAHNDFSRIVQNLPVVDNNGNDIRNNIYNNKSDDNIYYEIKPSFENIVKIFTLLLDININNINTIDNENDKDVYIMQYIIDQFKNKSKSIKVIKLDNNNLALKMESHQYEYLFSINHSHCVKPKKNRIDINKYLKMYLETKMTINIKNNEPMISYLQFSDVPLNYKRHFSIKIMNDIDYLFSFSNDFILNTIKLDDIDIVLNLLKLDNIINYIENVVYLNHSDDELENLYDKEYYVLVLVDPYRFNRMVNQYNALNARYNSNYYNSILNLNKLFKYFLPKFNDNVISHFLEYYFAQNTTYHKETILTVLFYCKINNNNIYQTFKNQITEEYFPTNQFQLFDIEFNLDLFDVTDVVNYMNNHGELNINNQFMDSLNKIYYKNRNKYFYVLDKLDKYLSFYHPSEEIKYEILNEFYKPQKFKYLQRYITFGIIELDIDKFNELSKRNPKIIYNLFNNQSTILSNHLSKFNKMEIPNIIQFLKTNKFDNMTIIDTLTKYYTFDNNNYINLYETLKVLQNNNMLIEFLENTNINIIKYIIEDNNIMTFINTSITNFNILTNFYQNFQIIMLKIIY